VSERAPPLRHTKWADRLFGWAFAQQRVLPVVLGLALAIALLAADEVFGGRPELALPYESLPGFYALVGALSVAAILVLAHVLNLLFARVPRPEDEP
jgi:hypothetical protein